eukprot:scaffold49519_cov18-Tisochrysis_lutea.AAC.1
MPQTEHAPGVRHSKRKTPDYAWKFSPTSTTAGCYLALKTPQSSTNEQCAVGAAKDSQYSSAIPALHPDPWEQDALQSYRACIRDVELIDAPPDRICPPQGGGGPKIDDAFQVVFGICESGTSVHLCARLAA